MLTRLKHINPIKKTLKSGKIVTYYYHRLTGKRIHGEPGTDEFIRNYGLAGKTEKSSDIGKISGLITEYLSSKEFSSLRDRTKLDYKKQLEKIEDKWGSAPLDILDDKRIRKDLLKWRDELAEKSARQADYAWSVFRRVVQFGVDNGELSHNRLTRPGRLYKNNRRDQIWFPNDVKNFMEVASPQIQAAMIMALNTGQRQGDLLSLSWSAYDGTAITLKQSKTGRKVYIPCTDSLKELLDAIPRNAVTILTNSRKLPPMDETWLSCILV